jgi:hypothetical protein
MAEAANFSSIESLLAIVESGTPAQDRPPAVSPAPQRSNAPPPVAHSSSPPATSGPARAVSPPAPAGSPAKKRTPVSSSVNDSTAPLSKRMTQADLKAANAEPMVQAALEVFGGQIVHVQREGPEPLGPAVSAES